MGKIIGRITEVSGIISKAELNELLPPYIVESGKVYDAPRINNLVKTRVGLDVVICQITGEYYAEKAIKGNFTGYFVNLVVKGYLSNNSFIQGMRTLPIVGAEVEMLDSEDLQIIYAQKIDESLAIGKDLYNSSQVIRLDINKVIPSHIGIFGNTGSGKSNTLTKLLSEYSTFIKNTKSAKIVVFDLNNEYVDDAICDKCNKKEYYISTRNMSGDSVPINIDDLDEDQWCVMLGATEATQRPVVKTAFHDKKTESDYENSIRNMIVNGQWNLFRALRYNLDQYIDNISGFNWHSQQNKFYYQGPERIYEDKAEFEICLNRIKVTIPEDKFDGFLFKLYFATITHISYGTQYEYIEPLLRRADKLIRDFKKVFEDTDKDDLFDEKSIAIIHLADANRDMREMIPSIVSNNMFKHQMDIKGKDKIRNIVNIVIDEAHNLLYEEDTTSKHQTITLETFEKIVKEGRKYGLFLCLASQRPSDISATIVSQLHNYFIHKLVNPLDITRIRKAVAFLDEESMNMLTVLGPGECVLSGTCVNMPLFMKVDQVKAEYRPNSDNVVLIGKNGILK